MMHGWEELHVRWLSGEVKSGAHQEMFWGRRGASDGVLCVHMSFIAAAQLINARGPLQGAVHSARVGSDELSRLPDTVSREVHDDAAARPTALSDHYLVVRGCPADPLALAWLVHATEAGWQGRQEFALLSRDRLPRTLAALTANLSSVQLPLSLRSSSLRRGMASERERDRGSQKERTRYAKRAYETEDIMMRGAIKIDVYIMGRASSLSEVAPSAAVETWRRAGR